MAGKSLRQLLQLNGISLADGSLLLSLHPDGSRLAAARGTTLCICPLRPASASSSRSSSAPSRSEADADPQTDMSIKDGAENCGDEDADEQEQEQEALRDRQATHGGAGPRSSNIPAAAGAATAGAAAGSPLPQPVPQHFICPASSGPPAISTDDITALAWLAFARPPSAVANSSFGGSLGHSSGSGDGGGVTAGPPGWLGRSGSGSRRTTSSGAGGSVFASIQVMLEDHELQRQQQAAGTAAIPQHPHPGYSLVLLLSGTRGGALQLHHADSGAVLLRQQLHTGPVVSIAVRTWRMGLNPNEAAEDVTVGWADAMVRLASWELRTAATTCYMAQTAAEARARGGSEGSGARGGGSGQSLFGLWGSSSSAAPSGPDIKPLAVQKWEMPPGAARGRSSSVVCCGQRPRDLYSLLQGIGSSSSTATGKTIFLSGGSRSPCLAAFEVDEQSPGGSGGALSYISSVATSVWGLARTARSVATAPLSLRDGIRSLVMNPLQLAGGSSATIATAFSAASAAAAGHAATPLASFPDASAGQRQPTTGVWRQYRDEGRAVLSLSPAPYGSLVAAVDSLGRLLLVEVGAMLVSRIWKGYRDAQVAWLEVQARTVARLLERQRAAEGSSVVEPPPAPSPPPQQGGCQQPSPLPQQQAQQDVVVAPALGPGPDQGDGNGRISSASPQLGRRGCGTGGHGHTSSGGGDGHGNGAEWSHKREDGEDQQRERGLVSSRGTRDQGQTRVHGSHAKRDDTVRCLALQGPASAAASVVPQNMLQTLSRPPQLPAAGCDLHGCRASKWVQGGAVGDECSRGTGAAEYVLLLAVYAPRRLTLELWFPLHGERLAAVGAPPKARLLQRGGGGVGGGGELGTWRVADAASAASPPMTPTGCMMCFAGRAPRLRLGAELEQSGTDIGSEGLEFLDVGTLFGLA